MHLARHWSNSFTLFSLASVMHLFGILAWRLKSIYASPEIKRRALDFTFNIGLKFASLKCPSLILL